MGWFSGKQQSSLDILAERQRRTEEEMTAIAKIVGEIHTALVVRDPGTRLSAEAYDGLRKTVIAGASQRRAHLVQLVELSNALNRGADTAQLISMVDEWLIQAGLAQVRDARRPELYEVLGGAGDGLHVLTAAWVDSQNGALIKRGTAERVQMPPRSLPRVPPREAVPSAPATEPSDPTEPSAPDRTEPSAPDRTEPSAPDRTVPSAPDRTVPSSPDPQALSEPDAQDQEAVADVEPPTADRSGNVEPALDESVGPPAAGATPDASQHEPVDGIVSEPPAETPTADTQQQPSPPGLPSPHNPDQANGSTS